ncbi:MAG: hypothetical protein JST86_14375 [Bacteroidetes bacterium]|nr:hypothetical protein [Bacteroidota bacterium]
MKISFRYRNSFIVLFTIAACLFFLTTCINNSGNSASKEPAAYKDFAGSAACARCHKDIYDAHIKTAHFHTSEVASVQTIKGSFDSGKNTFLYNNGQEMIMEKRPDGVYQAGYVNGTLNRSERFDFTVGSATRGQSYMSWNGDKLVQLPLTYFTATDQWSNSPGYPNRLAFNRPITARCLECHATYAENMPDTSSESSVFNKNALILGVDCEKCHGPGAKHVEFQTSNPQEKTAQFIINPKNFTRQQSLDLCALCHGGRLQKSKPSFSFTSGDKLADFFTVDNTPQNTNAIDVHGNQLGLLKASKCFTMSKTLTCVTCHNTHENQKGQVALFSQQCMGCHNEKHTVATTQCKMKDSLGAVIDGKCTACHMPEQQSMSIAVMLQGNTVPTPAKMHTHLIKAYPEETQKVLALLKEKNK